MFEKIFGIFRKRKKAAISQEIPGEMDEDMFAGIKLSYKGKFYDFSLDTEIEAFLDSYQFIE